MGAKREQGKQSGKRAVGCRREKIAVPGIALLIHQPLKYIHSSAHTRYADVYRRETEASYSDLYSISSSSAMGFWKQSRLGVQPGFTGEKKKGEGKKKERKKKGEFTVTLVRRRQSLARSEGERETRKQGKARESGEKKDRKRRERKRNGENVKRGTRKKNDTYDV